MSNTKPLATMLIWKRMRTYLRKIAINVLCEIIAQNISQNNNIRMISKWANRLYLVQFNLLIYCIVWLEIYHHLNIICNVYNKIPHNITSSKYIEIMKCIHISCLTISDISSNKSKCCWNLKVYKKWMENFFNTKVIISHDFRCCCWCFCILGVVFC